MLNKKTKIVKETKKLLEDISIEIMTGFKQITLSAFRNEKKQVSMKYIVAVAFFYLGFIYAECQGDMNQDSYLDVLDEEGCRQMGDPIIYVLHIALVRNLNGRAWFVPVPRTSLAIEPRLGLRR